MSFDDDADEDAPGFRQPPHPDDRIWRHPSEIDGQPVSAAGAFAALAPIRGRTWRAAAAFGALGVVVVGVAVVGLAIEDPGSGGTAGQDPSTSSAGSEAADEAEAAVADQVGPTVVGLDGGSGVVVRADGLVLTSASLVGDEPVEVRLPDGTLVDADLVGVDDVTGIAVLDLPGDGHAAAEQASDVELEPGGDAFTVGRAFTTDSGEAAATARATAGVVGASRKLQGDDESSLDGVVEVTGDAGPDVLGGPVVEPDGTVIGVTTALGGGRASYFTPIDAGRKVTDDLLLSGRVHHSWLGIEGMDAPAAGRPASGESGGTGAKVAQVYPGGPAEMAGLRQGDVIVELAGRPVGRMPDLVRRLRTLSPGDQIDLTLEREGVRTTVTVTLGERTVR